MPLSLRIPVAIKFTTAAYGEVDYFSYIASASIEENGILRDADGDELGTQYGLSAAESQNYFTKLVYQFDGDKSIFFTYNYYE